MKYSLTKPDRPTVRHGRSLPIFLRGLTFVVLLGAFTPVAIAQVGDAGISTAQPEESKRPEQPEQRSQPEHPELPADDAGTTPSTAPDHTPSGAGDAGADAPPPIQELPSRATRHARSVFVVAGVDVSAAADDAERARSKAQSDGRAQAMDILLRRLTAEEDWVYLPKLSLGQLADAAVAVTSIPVTGSDGAGAGDTGAGTGQSGSGQSGNGQSGNGSDSGTGSAPGVAAQFPGLSHKRAVMLAREDLPALEESFAVFDEKSSRTTYQATLTHRFKADDIRGILTAAGLPFSDSQSRAALIVPVLQTGTGLYLWEHNNPWARAWRARPLINELTPFLLPAGDISDTQLVSAAEAEALSQDALARLAERYDVSQIIIAQGNLDHTDQHFRLRVRLYDGYLAGGSRRQGAITAGSSSTLYDADPDGAQIADRALLEAWFNGDETDFPALARRAVESTVAQYAGGWKKQTIVDHSIQTQITLQAYFSDIKEWNLIRDTLQQSPLIAHFSTGLLTTSGTTIDIRLLGSAPQLILAMQQRGLTVWSAGDENWNIASVDTARIIRAGDSEAQQAGTPGPQGAGGGRSRGQPGVPAGPPPETWRDSENDGPQGARPGADGPGAGGPQTGQPRGQTPQGEDWRDAPPPGSGPPDAASAATPESLVSERGGRDTDEEESNEGNIENLDGLY